MENFERKPNIFVRIGTFFKGLFQFIIVFSLIFIIVSVILFGPKKATEKIAEATYGVFKKVDTDVKIEENNILENELTVPNEKIIKKEKPKIINIEIPYEEQLLPEFNEEKYNNANKLYSENEVQGLANTWYYNQLDEYGKKIYLKLKSESGYFLEGEHTFDFGYAFNDLLNQEDGAIILESAFQQSVNALMFDFPQLFFVNIRNISIQIQKTTYFTNRTVYSVTISNSANRTFYIDELNTKEEVQEARQLMEKIRYNIMERIVNPNDPYNVAKVAHDYIVDTVNYDQSLLEPNIYNMYGALANKKAVCEGYAKAYKYFLDYYGIPNIIVAGKGRNDRGGIEKHAWNYININGNWYAVDTTWDDPIIIGDNRFVDDSFKYRYFLKGESDFVTTHVPDGEIVENFGFKYPTLSEESYAN